MLRAVSAVTRTSVCAACCVCCHPHISVCCVLCLLSPAHQCVLRAVCCHPHISVCCVLSAVTCTSVCVACCLLSLAPIRYHWVPNPPQPLLLSSNMNTQVHSTTILAVVVHGSGTWSLALQKVWYCCPLRKVQASLWARTISYLMVIKVVLWG